MEEPPGSERAEVATAEGSQILGATVTSPHSLCSLVDAHFELLLPGRARTKEQHEEKPKYDMMGATIAVGHGSVV